MIRLEGVCKRFGEREVLKDVTLEVARGEFVMVTGPSGAGKSLLLAIIAGLEAPSGGRVRIDGADMAGVAPERRPVTLVFQRHALFPHLTVFENIAFSLRARRVPRAAVRARVDELLALTGLASYAHAKPDVLSGGQSQRVAVARALAADARVVLFDEPLNSLDPQARHALRALLARAHGATGFTALYVTHCREEARAFGGRLVVLDGGRLAGGETPDGATTNG